MEANVSSIKTEKAPESLPADLSEIRMIRMEQARKILDVSISTLRALMDRSVNPLPNVRIGRSRRIPLAPFLWWKEKLAK